jgi:hypothetical protein
MFSTYILLDYENVQPADLALLKAEHFLIYIFLGSKQDKISFELAASVQEFGKRVNYIKASASGTNALDFYITYYLGQLVLKDPKACFRIVSKDTGFDALIQHLQAQNITVSRVEDIQSIFRKLPKAPVLSTPPQKQTTNIATQTTNQKQAEIQAQTKASEQKTNTDKTDDVLKDLRRRGKSRPRTLKALSNTINSLFQNKLPEKEIQKILKALQKQKLISIQNEKVSYSL